MGELVLIGAAVAGGVYAYKRHDKKVTAKRVLRECNGALGEEGLSVRALHEDFEINLGRRLIKKSTARHLTPDQFRGLCASMGYSPNVQFLLERTWHAKKGCKNQFLRNEKFRAKHCGTCSVEPQGCVAGDRDVGAAAAAQVPPVLEGDPLLEERGMPPPSALPVTFRSVLHAQDPSCSPSQLDHARRPETFVATGLPVDSCVTDDECSPPPGCGPASHLAPASALGEAAFV
eukprot:TRINITY_DN56971_c0_g1_i1.p1 TRINITY_DN56971_c0_g1~~TRINITY_DN56971_c0_g1_i1.p1  ORF type:complete len:232 (-),score=20.51 TRINITY_DN56971_c0_g1_i1:201-896(-)